MERNEEPSDDPYRAPGVDSMEPPPALPPSQPPTAGKAIVIGILLAIGLPIAAIVLLFALCTALVALG